MKNPFSKKPGPAHAGEPAPSEKDPASEDLVLDNPTPGQEYPGINLDVCRQRIANGEPASAVAGWLVANYPGYFPDVETAESAL